MNFLIWLLKRTKRKLFGGEWGWVYKYRQAIQFEMPIAIVATFLCGMLWTLVMGIIAMSLINDRETLKITVNCILACPPVFFFYNWFYTLYDAYKTEQMATWNRLKETE